MILSIVLIAALLAPLLVLTSEGKYTEEGPESRSLSHGYFIKNQGQINNSDIEYYGRVPDGYITLDSNSVSFWSDSSQKSDLLSFETSDDVVIVGHSEQDYRCHYFLGSRGTYTDVSCYQSLEYRDFTKGVNLAVCYVEDGIDFTFELKEDLSAEEIDTFWDDIKIDKSNLVLGSSGIRFHFDLPIDDSHRYRISQIDDRSLLSICLGGSESDRAQCMTRDQEGNLYIAGSTYSPEFPLRNEFQSYQGGMDAFVTKMNADGSIIYSTCIGGDYTNLLLSEPDDVAEDIAIDAEGNVYLTGNTKSNDFPTENPLYSVSENLTILRGEYQDHQGDVFILKLNSTGNGIEYSTYYGGTNGECGTSIDIDSDGKVFVGGWTSSENIPLINPIDSESYDLFDGFILCLSAAGDEFLFSSFIGGGGIDRVKDLA
ncbi:MAG: SBBP repeat-containing protein, partial [Candidatus Thorarchaeota archaeon]